MVEPAQGKISLAFLIAHSFSNIFSKKYIKIFSEALVFSKMLAMMVVAIETGGEERVDVVEKKMSEKMVFSRGGSGGADVLDYGEHDGERIIIHDDDRR